MNKIKALLIVVLVAGIGCVSARIIYLKRQARAEAARYLARARTRPEVRSVHRTPSSEPAVSEPAVTAASEPPPAPKPAPVRPRPQFTPPQPAQPGNPGRVLHDPMAREAMALVGNDPDAEAYWLAAINDPSVPGPEREDLIEDLNENGFINGRTPVPADLPLILRRIEIVEALEPMDEVNAAAKQEVLKDLGNMVDRFAGP